jgi:hypothetical protein
LNFLEIFKRVGEILTNRNVDLKALHARFMFLSENLPKNFPEILKPVVRDQRDSMMEESLPMLNFKNTDFRDQATKICKGAMMPIFFY